MDLHEMSCDLNYYKLITTFFFQEAIDLVLLKEMSSTGTATLSLGGDYAIVEVREGSGLTDVAASIYKNVSLFEDTDRGRQRCRFVLNIGGF